MTGTVSIGLPKDIVAWIEHDLGVAVVRQARIGSGASREIWAIDLQTGGAHDLRTAVVRLDAGAGPVSGTRLNLGREAAVYRALRGSGLPIPALLAVEPEGRAILMQRMYGDENLSTIDDGHRRRRIGCAYLAWLGRLHQLKVDELTDDAISIPSSGPAHALDDLDLWSAIMRDRCAGWTTPAAEFAVDWLRLNAPVTSSATSMCHGDAGPGNFLFDGDDVTAMLDWEFAHVGDPHDDLAWVAVRNPLFGFPIEIRAAFDVWHDTTGLAVEKIRLEYYRVFVLTRMLISCDAAVAWKKGVVDESILTHSVLRPWLATAIPAAIRLSGGGTREVDQLSAAAVRVLEASEYRTVAAMIPSLEPFETILEH